MADLLVRCRQLCNEKGIHQKTFVIIGVLANLFWMTIMMEMIEKLARGQSNNWSALTLVGPHEWIPLKSEEDTNVALVTLAFSITYMISCVFLIYSGCTKRKEFSVPWSVCESAVIFYQVVTAFATAVTQMKDNRPLVALDSVFGAMLVLYTALTRKSDWWDRWLEDEPDNIVFVMQPLKNRERVAARRRVTRRVSATTHSRIKQFSSAYDPELNLPFIDEDVKEGATTCSYLSEHSRGGATPASGLRTLSSGVSMDAIHSEAIESCTEVEDTTSRSEEREYEDEILAWVVRKPKDSSKEVPSPSSGYATPAIGITLAEIHQPPAENYL